MNTRTAIDDTTGPSALHVAFNNDRQYFSVALEGGFSIYTSETCELYMEQEIEDRIRMAVMLESSQIIGLLKGKFQPSSDSDRLALWDSSQRKEVASVTTREPIIRVCLSKSHISLVFKRSVTLYKHQPKLEKVATYETTSNTLGLCCLGTRMLVFPGRSTGQIQLLNLTDRNVSIVPAHTSPLRALELSSNEEIIASASEKGTLIRLHSSSTSARVGELRRGVTPATVFSIAISPSNSLLAVTSDTNTLHVFELPFQASGGGQDSRKASSSSAEAGWHNVENPSVAASNAGYGGFLKWGNLAKLPFAPRVFTDVYSFTSATFDPGKEDSALEQAPTGIRSSSTADPDDGPPKGIAGWIDDQTVAVISGGREARYERFALAQDGLGKTVCVRVGRSRFLVPN